MEITGREGRVQYAHISHKTPAWFGVFIAIAMFSVDKAFMLHYSFRLVMRSVHFVRVSESSLARHLGMLKTLGTEDWALGIRWDG